MGGRADEHGRVRIRVPDGGEVELCDLQGCVTVFHEKVDASDGGHEASAGGSGTGSDLDWVEAALRQRADLALRPIGEDTEMALVTPRAEEPEIGWVEMPIARFDEPVQVPVLQGIDSESAAGLAADSAIDRVVHVVAVGRHVDLSLLAPLHDTLGEDGVVAVTVIAL
jgi:hypothetical protein